MTGTYGQDWASYQSATPPTTGLGFAFVKATEGTGYTNPLHAAQAAHARADGLVVGHYHYPHMAADPVIEAGYFLSAAKPQTGDILVLDWEGYDDANKGVAFSRQIAYKVAFLARLRSALPLHQVGTYANTDYLNRDPHGEYGDFLWIATANKPAGQPGIDHMWLFHQYGASGVDRDYCPLTFAQLRSWAHAKENDMPMTDAEIDKLAVRVALRTNSYRNEAADAASVKAGHGHIPDVYGRIVDTHEKVGALAIGGIDLDALAVKVAALLPKPATAADIADLLAARMKS
jgi:hypothetical protein